MRRTHAKAARDYTYLDGHTLLDDAVTAMDEVQNLMLQPTKAKATEMLEGLIGIWFYEAQRDGRDLDARCKKIARDYGYEDQLS